jgi:RTX calcium-binding nonapeptide repeat (4 copies)
MKTAGRAGFESSSRYRQKSTSEGVNMSKVFNQTNNQFNMGVHFNNPALTGPITITSAGVIVENNAAAGLLLEGGAYSVNVSGLLSSSALASYGLSLGLAAVATPNQISTIVVGTTGEIQGAAYAIAAFHSANVTNSGLLSGGNGIYVAGGSAAYSIVNKGEIDVTTGGLAIWTNDAANHTINNSGSIWGNISGAGAIASNETIINSGHLFGQIFARDGVDSVTNSGVIEGAIYLDAGADVLVNTGTITGDINGWTGADNIQNRGTLNGFMLAGEDKDVLTNSGTINGGVDAWTGNDTFTNTGTVNGWIFMGEGDDKFIGGATRENVADQSGADNYSFGDGIDNFDAVGAGSSVGNDIVNGGLNSGLNLSAGIYGDEYNASDAIGDVSVNLYTVARVDSVSGISYLASKAQGAETGTDTVLAFETVYVGAGNDVVFGNSLANYLSGGGGSDHLFGGAGNDYLAGDAGADFIAGETGRDTLDGGADVLVDTFIYKALTDSTVAFSGRDVLLNFTDGDRIDFSQMVVATGDVNHFAGADVNFDGLIGAVRALTNATGWIIQVDSNGDKIADMSIAVNDASHSNVTDWSDNFLF